MIMTMVALLSMTAMTAQTNNSEKNKPQQEMKRMSHEEMTTQMATKLNLSDEQKTKVAALNKEYQDCLMPEPPQRPNGQKAGKGNSEQTNAQASGNMSETKRPNGKMKGNSQLRAKRQEYEKKLKGILSDEQYKSYQTMRPQRKGGKPQGQMKKRQTTTE